MKTKKTLIIAIITFCASAAIHAATLTPREIQRFHDDLGIDLTPQQQTQIAQIVKPAAPWPVWRTNATARINTHRKTNLQITITDQNGNPLPNATIHIKQTRTPFHFGGILNLYYWKGNTHNYRKTIKILFNALGCQNALKPKLTRKHPLLPEFFTWAQTNNIPVRGHLLIWPDNGALPDYDPYKIQQALTALTDAQAQTNPPATQATINTLKTNLIDITNFQIGDWASKWPVYEWDVINEVLERHGIPDALNDYSQMAQWFNIAATNKILPNCKLMINEYQIISAKWWAPNSSWGFNKRAKYYSQQIDRIFNDGGHIDRIGFQSRFKFGYRSPDEYDYRLTHFENKYPNLDLVATEFEIMTYGAVTNEITRAKMTEEVMTTYFSHPNVTGFNAWTFKSNAENALCDTNGNLKLNGLIWYYLHRIRYATDTNLTANANGQTTLRAYKGNYEITTQYNTQTTNTILSLTSNQTITIKINTPTPQTLYNAWINTYTNNINNQTNLLVDPDHDGICNLAEYALGGDPSNPENIGKQPNFSTQDAQETDQIKFVFVRRKDYAACGLTYLLEKTTNLSTTASWINAGETTSGTTSIDANFETVTNLIPINPVGNQQFIRLRVRIQ